MDGTTMTSHYYDFHFEASQDLDSQLKKLDSLADVPELILCHHDKEDIPWNSTIHLALTSSKARELNIEFARRGYMVCRAPQEGTLFVHKKAVEGSWPAVNDGTYSMDTSSGLVYTLTGPRRGGDALSMVVVFSSVATNSYSQLLDRHFMQNFPGLEKSVVDSAAVLRIADLGGVVGSFYLPTHHDGSNSSKVAEFIARIAGDLGIKRTAVLLYGASKGGTGALYHALTGGFSCVSVDPFVSNDHRNTPGTDPYYINTEIFTASLEATLSSSVEVLKSQTFDSEWRPMISLVSSPGSAEYPSIQHFVNAYASQYINFVVVNHPLIRRHKDVAGRTVPLVLGLMNLELLGIRPSIGSRFDV